MTTERRERGFLTLTIDGATEYFSTVQDVGNRRCSTPVKLCGVEWTMEVYRSGSYLAAAIRYAGSVPFQDDPCFTVNPVVRVRSSTSEDAIRHFDTKISKGFTSGSTGIFVYLGSLLDPAYGYLKNDSVTIVCSVMVKSAANSTFDAKRHCTDLKVVVGVRHFHVNKGFLATHCDYFDALLFGGVGERPKDEVSLDGLGIEVDPDDFATFMGVISPAQAVVTKDNVAAVMPLANFFGAKAILEKCERVAIDNLEPADAIRLTDKCGLRDLTEQLFAKVRMCDLVQLASDDVLPTLSKETSDQVTKELLRRLTQPE